MQKKLDLILIQSSSIIIRHLSRILIDHQLYIFFFITNFDNQADFWQHKSPQLFSVTDFLKQLFSRLVCFFSLYVTSCYFLWQRWFFYTHARVWREFMPASDNRFSMIQRIFNNWIDAHGLQRYEKTGTKP